MGLGHQEQQRRWQMQGTALQTQELDLRLSMEFPDQRVHPRGYQAMIDQNLQVMDLRREGMGLTRPSLGTDSAEDRLGSCRFVEMGYQVRILAYKGDAALPGSPIDGDAAAGARPPALPLGEELPGVTGVGRMLFSGVEPGEGPVGLPPPGELGNGLKEGPLMGETGTGADAEAPEGAGPGPEEETTAGVNPELTPGVDIPADADGETTPGVKPDTTPGVDTPTEGALVAAAEPAAEGDPVGVAPGREPPPGVEPVPEVDPAAGVETPVGLPTDTVPGAWADPAADGETITGVDRPPGLGLETRETRIEPPQGAEEKVGDQPGELTSGSVGVGPLPGVRPGADPDPAVDGEIAGEDRPGSGDGTADSDPETDAELGADVGFGADAETPVGVDVPGAADEKGVTVGDGKLAPALYQLLTEKRSQVWRSMEQWAPEGQRQDWKQYLVKIQR
ncbi:hypothetical protein CONLIGDRAFT_684535 [Coniochaeta ligniaria NRRL 30616]|uniref:Uncharacterized protein n=1 Tax=Coniochaeta ligniaria NRRL 30616 TaxID=1408157 RepID=A0A1J7J9X1_9PEZI|nr:hypothetical protein CONLIGDRAFT_684535 [Coniochaeta ligniaria NRRL 30616]